MATPKNRPYTRHKGGTYAVQIPAVVTRKDVRSVEWPNIKAQLFSNIVSLYEDAFNYVEQDIRNKK